jgi:soluble lytic murein transglycosylase-like protein
MRSIFPAVLLAVAGLAASALAQTATTLPHRPPAAVKPTKAAAHGRTPVRPAAHPRRAVHHAHSVHHAHRVVRHPVFVPPPPVIELDEIAVDPKLPTVLDASNAELYRRIFQDQAASRWRAADGEIGRLTDKTLMGYVGAQRLLARGYRASYGELAAWLQEYNDHPDAPAIYRLALARRPRGASGELTPASFVGQAPSSPAFAAARTVTGADATRAAALRVRLGQMANDGGYNAAFALLDRKSTADLLGPQEVELWRGRIRTRALEADSQRGLQVPVEIGMPPDANWNAGLAAFTGGDMAEAARRFEMVADAPPDQASSWTLSAGAFWAARANLLAGNPQKFAPYLKRAALHNRTFYGLIAQKALGMKIVAEWNVPPIGSDAASLLRNDRAGHRALALLQLGAATAAQRELFAASLDADPQYVTAILSLANQAVLPALSVRVANAAWDLRHRIAGYDGASYPLPPWQPASGFSIDRALLYGFMRQESAFNPKARSYVGAMGLLQLMPRTARIVRAKYAPEAAGGNPYDPSVNMALGQAYITALMGDVDDDLVRTAAAYNGGPGNVSRWDNTLHASADPLLYVASIPLDETRDFVQRVLANYWLYEIRLGQPTPSLDQMAAHEWPRYTAQDVRR